MPGRLQSQRISAGTFSDFGSARFGRARRPRLKPYLSGTPFHRSHRERDLGLSGSRMMKMAGDPSAPTRSMVTVPTAVS
jgi:hypothetical protein